jgi:hypothetical protein
LYWNSDTEVLKVGKKFYHKGDEIPARSMDEERVRLLRKKGDIIDTLPGAEPKPAPPKPEAKPEAKTDSKPVAKNPSKKQNKRGKK